MDRKWLVALAYRMHGEATWQYENAVESGELLTPVDILLEYKKIDDREVVLLSAIEISGADYEMAKGVLG